MEKFSQIMSKIPLFAGLPEDQLESVQRIVVEKQFGKGEAIFSEGYAADGFYVVVSGRVKIHKLSLDGKEKILHMFGPGQPFGEVAVFSGQKFPAHAQAISASRLLFFPRTAFVGLITANPSLALNMLAVLSRRLRQFADQIENLSLKEVPARLASYLISLADQQNAVDQVTLTTSKGQLASILGTIPETLSRILARLSAQNLIRVEGRTIALLDRQGLEDLAQRGKDTE